MCFYLLPGYQAWERNEFVLFCCGFCFCFCLTVISRGVPELWFKCSVFFGMFCVFTYGDISAGTHAFFLPGHISTGTHRSFLRGHIGTGTLVSFLKGHIIVWTHMSFLPEHISTGKHQCEDTSVWGHIIVGTNLGGDHIGLTQVKVYCINACINCLCIFLVSSCLTRTSR